MVMNSELKRNARAQLGGNIFAPAAYNYSAMRGAAPTMPSEGCRKCGSALPRGYNNEKTPVDRRRTAIRMRYG